MTTYSYDTWSEKLTGIVTRDYLDTEIQNRSYEYSQAGDIETITDAVNNVVYSYVYDDLHRLKGETNSGPDGPLTYLYDAIGNMTSRIAGADAYTYEYNSAGPHAVSRVIINGTPRPYTYDDNGNMLTGKDFTNPSSPVPRTITWNADNMPVSVTRSGVTTSFKYDGLGKRAKKQVGGASPTYFIGTEYEVIAGVGTKYIFAGNLRIAKVSPTGVYYFHKDHLRSSTVMTGGTGAVVETSEYRPYGSFRNQSGTAVSDYKFTDQEWDAESGLYNYDARLYDPVIGRFISADSIVPRTFDPQILNRYSYVRNNPLIYVDPSGHRLGDGYSHDDHDFDDNGNGSSGLSGGGAGGGNGNPMDLQNAFVSRAWGSLDEMKKTMSYGYNAVQNAPTFDLGNSIIGKIWNAPNTVVGLFWGGLGWALGADVKIENNAIQFIDHPLMLSRSAITIGNTISYAPGFGPHEPFRGYTVADHERQHTYQGELIGVGYLPSNILGGLFGLAIDGFWGGPNSANWNERGPYLSPPRPW